MEQGEVHFGSGDGSDCIKNESSSEVVSPKPGRKQHLLKLLEQSIFTEWKK